MAQRATNSTMTPSYKQDPFKFKNDLIFLKDAVDSSYLLHTLGFVISKETNSELRASCLIHGGDNTTSFRLNKKTKTWSCFSHACDEVHGKDIIGLIRACRGCGFMEAVKFLKEIVGVGDDIDQTAVYAYKRSKDKSDFIHEFSPDEDRGVKSKYLDEKTLRANIYLRTSYFNKEDGFSNETLNYFDISGGYIDSEGVKRDVIPIRDTDGVLVGCSFSSTKRATLYKDKYIITPNLDKDKVLYNLNNAISYLKEKPLIIVEGFKGVWRLHDYGIHNVAACMGTTVTQGQRNLLVAHAEHGVVLMFDNDGPGISGMVRSFMELSRKVPTSLVFITEVDEKGDGLDPADLSKDAVYTYLESYI